MAGDKDAHRSHGFIQELIRRRIFRSAGAYIVASWVLVQVASIVFPEFNAPRWSMRALIIMLIAGFPFAMLLAWTLDITASGVVRTKHSQYSQTREGILRGGILAVATLLSAGALWWVWTGVVQPTTERPERTTFKANPIVAVSTPRMISGSDSIAWLGQGVANLIRNELAESQHVVVLSASGWNKIAGDAGTDDQLVELATNAGIDYLVHGEYLQSPDGIVLTLGIDDLESGIEIQGARIVKADAAEIISGSSEMNVRIRQALQIPLQQSVKRLSADFATRNMDAYEAYVAGLGYFINFDYQQAEQAFRAALDIAPDYHMARFRLAEVLESSGHSELAWREIDAIPENAALSERERLYVEGAKHYFIHERDPFRAIEIYRELVDKYPYDMEARQLLGDSYWLAYQEDAAIVEFRRLAETHSYDPSAWMALGERLLDVGQLDEAAQALNRFMDAEPQNPHAHALLGNLWLLRDDPASAIAAYERSQQLRPGFVVATLGLARALYLNGETEKAEAQWRRLIEDDSAAGQYRIEAAFDLTGVLRGQGRFEDAIAALATVDAAVRKEGLYTATMLSTLGLLHLELGNPKFAAQLIDQAIAESPGVATRHLFARGVMELRDGDLDAVTATADEIRSLALPPEDPDRTEDKAASYLLGLAALARGDLPAAESALTEALRKDGYEYALYDLGHADYLAEAGDLQAAAELAETAMSARDPGDLRLDLEFDRARASRLLGDLLQRLDR
jgi:tetratricopeptide (TPR) repeat protein